MIEVILGQKPDECTQNEGKAGAEHVSNIPFSRTSRPWHANHRNGHSCSSDSDGPCKQHDLLMRLRGMPLRTGVLHPGCRSPRCPGRPGRGGCPHPPPQSSLPACTRHLLRPTSVPCERQDCLANSAHSLFSLTAAPQSPYGHLKTRHATTFGTVKHTEHCFPPQPSDLLSQ